MLDLGANSDAKPEHLVQYRDYGKYLCRESTWNRIPRVGLFNIGTEEKKEMS